MRPSTATDGGVNPDTRQYGYLYKDKLESNVSVTFNEFILTEEHLGNLNIDVEADIGGTAIRSNTIVTERVRVEKAANDEKEENVNERRVYALPTTDSAARLTAEQQKSNAEYIFDHLAKEGWSIEAISGLLGNIHHESWFNPGVWQSNQNTDLGYGLVQWTPVRTKFFAWAGIVSANEADEMAINEPKRLMDLQLEYLTWSSLSTTPSGQREWFATLEYNSPYRMNFEEYVVSNHNVSDLTLVFHASYERSNDNTVWLQKRVEHAIEWYQHFSNR